MNLRNLLGGSAVLVSLAAYASAATPLSATDSNTLISAYQLTQFDVQECSALAPKPSITNGDDVVPPDILLLSDKICRDARAYQPLLQKLAADHNFALPDDLPFYLTSRYAALVRDDGVHHGRKYLKDQISSHEDSLAIFQEEMQTGSDPQIIRTVAVAIPLVQSNLNALEASLAKH